MKEREALDVLVPPFEASDGDWAEIVRVAAFPDAEPKRSFTRRRLAVASAVLAVAATLVVTPAFGLGGFLLGLIGRTDVPFTGKPAPVEIKREFYDLGLGAPSGMAPEAIASQTRRVATFRVRGKTSVLWVAPTRAGGFCWQLSGQFGGCRARRDERARPVNDPGFVHPERLGVTYQEHTERDVAYVTLIGGDIVTPEAHTLLVEYADGTSTDIGFTYVSKPIDAGFFLAEVPGGHDTERTRPTAVVLRDESGDVLARQPFRYLSPQQRAAQERRRRREFREHAPPPVQPLAHVPPPTAPLQRGEADGVTIVAGRNGSVVFDTSRATPTTRKLISGLVGYGCFRRVPYHAEPVVLSQAISTRSHRVAIRIEGLRTPFLGCDIQGGYGHRWPDRLGGHSAVEVAFTPAARRFFHDRATARDLALFVRSRAMQRIRRQEGAALDAAIRARYRSAITRLASPSAPLPPSRIGYATSGHTTTFVEASPTGRRFHVRVLDGRVVAHNLKELSLVF
jgi:hypothetical protein